MNVKDIIINDTNELTVVTYNLASEIISVILPSCQEYCSLLFEGIIEMYSLLTKPVNGPASPLAIKI
jgi:hypothetical protein